MKAIDGISWKLLSIFGLPTLLCIVAFAAFYFRAPLLYATKEEVAPIREQVNIQAVRQEYIVDTVAEIKRTVDDLAKEILKKKE